MLFLTEKQIREVENAAMETVSEIMLVESAATSLCRELEGFNSVRIYCGKGNNGSDGYATAVFLNKKGIY